MRMKRLEVFLLFCRVILIDKVWNNNRLERIPRKFEKDYIF